LIDKIGKYKITQDKNSFRITYIFTLSDIFGAILYLMGLSLGILLLYLAINRFGIDKVYTFNFWFFLIFGGFLIIWCLLMLIFGFYSPQKGILQINRNNNEIIIRDFLKTVKINSSSVRTMYCELIDSNRPRQKYGMFIIGLQNGDKIECFIIRSTIPIDLGRKLDKDILDTANQIKKKINDFIMI